MKKLFLVSLIFSIVVCFNLYSQTPIHNRGVVVEFDNNSFVVDTVKYLYTDSTTFKFANETPAQKSNIMLGSSVDVKGYKYSQKNYAKDIIIDDGSGFKDIDLKGTVQTVFTGVIVVDGYTFGVTDTTNLFYFNGDLAYFDSIKVGDKVELYAKNYNGEFLVINLRILNGTNNVVNHKGPISFVGDNYFTLNGRNYYTNSNSIIQFSSLKSARIKDVFIKDSVFVNAKFENYRYNIVKTTINKTKDSSIVKGLSQKVNPLGSTIEIEINNEKFIYKKGYSEFNSNDPNITKIEQVKSNSTLNLKIAKFSNDANKFIESLTVLREKSGSIKINGTIYANEYNRIVVNNNIIEVIDTTYIINESGMPLGISDLNVGLNIEIDADIYNNQYIAQKILIKKSFESAFTVKGIVEGKDQTSVTINKQKFSVTPGVKIYLTNSGMGLFDDIKPGQLIELNCEYNNSTLNAKRIFIFNSEFSNSMTIVDTVQSKSKYGFYIQDNLVTIGSQTTIKNFDGEKATLSDIQKGSLLRVVANKIHSGYVAYFIEILDKASSEKFKVAYATRINKDTLITSWNYVFTNAQTKYYLFDKTATTLASIKLNDKLHIEYYTENNKNIAKKIYVLNNYIPNNYSLLGKMNSKTTNSVIIDDEKYSTQFFSKLFNKNNSSITLSELSDNSIVEVNGMFDGKNIINLKEILLDGESYPDTLKSFDEKGSNYIVVGGRFYFVDANTKYFNKSGQAITFAQLTDNLKLKVKAKYLNNIRIAVEVRVLDGNTSIEENYIDNYVSIYPNPAISKFNIKFYNPDENVSIKIFDVIGNVLYEQSFTYINQGQIINIENGLSSGVYLVQINSKNHNSIQKLIIK